MTSRQAQVQRETRETNVNLVFNLDGAGEWEIASGIRMFDHLLSQLVRHGGFDLTLSATGDDPHHVVEDIGLCLGKAFGQALGNKEGICRMASASVPMDEALSSVAVDISGRGYAVLKLDFADNDMAGFSSDLIRHFLEAFASEARLTLHGRFDYGINDHHKAESLFKALGRALDEATQIDPRRVGELPSTKGVIES